MELHLIRHGQTDWNEERRVQGQSDSRLTELGEQQASSLGQRLEPVEFNKAFCSSSLRTRQTAARLFAGTDLEIEYLDSLREIFLGPWEGTLYDEIEQRDPDSFRHFWEEPHLFNVDGAESFFDLQARAVAAIEQIAKRHLNQCIALVSHGALIKTLLCHAEGRPMHELWTPPHMHNCAHSIIRVREDGTREIIQYADIPFSDLER
ncbi:MAG: histidine phosphatase family protein [Gammaproteobacteria bacterium]|nr:histidine phosphatase family protein [Gammaproteobacteria bacterium]MDD9896684.1 histidine phosphatase family protein [Gammaproteobacteria bacterium]MDD9959567.1 histidine phosphatase family protein [Gammaproteobacteria bacterium]